LDVKQDRIKRKDSSLSAKRIHVGQNVGTLAHKTGKEEQDVNALIDRSGCQMTLTTAFKSNGLEALS
jgi:hypothetical protein